MASSRSASTALVDRIARETVALALESEDRVLSARRLTMVAQHNRFALELTLARFSQPRPHRAPSPTVSKGVAMLRDALDLVGRRDPFPAAG